MLEFISLFFYCSLRTKNLPWELAPQFLGRGMISTLDTAGYTVNCWLDLQWGRPSIPHALFTCTWGFPKANTDLGVGGGGREFVVGISKLPITKTNALSSRWTWIFIVVQESTLISLRYMQHATNCPSLISFWWQLAWHGRGLSAGITPYLACLWSVQVYKTFA